MAVSWEEKKVLHDSKSDLPLVSKYYLKCPWILLSMTKGTMQFHCCFIVLKVFDLNGIECSFENEFTRPTSPQLHIVNKIVFKASRTIDT